MKVKEIIRYLQECPPEAEVGYEHMYVDYIHQESPEYVEMEGLHYSRIDRQKIQ